MWLRLGPSLLVGRREAQFGKEFESGVTRYASLRADVETARTTYLDVGLGANLPCDCPFVETQDGARPAHHTNAKILTVDLAAQLVPKPLKRVLQHLWTAAINLSPFNVGYRNHATGAPAYAPKTMRQVVFLADSSGIVSSCAIATAVEPVSGNLRANKRLNRFTLRDVRSRPKRAASHATPLCGYPSMPGNAARILGRRFASPR